jgi:glutamate decarboxylase
MPINERDTVSEHLADCVFAGRDMTKHVPKHRSPRNETLPRDAFQVVPDELITDGNARQNLAPFCQTWAEPELLALMSLSVDKNMIDRRPPPISAPSRRRTSMGSRWLPCQR